MSRLPCLPLSLLRWIQPLCHSDLVLNPPFIASTSTPSCWRVWRAFPPRYGTRHRVWITCSTPFHSHCGSFFFSFSAPLFSLTIIRNLLRALRVRRVDKKPSGLDNVQNPTSTFHHDSHWCSSVLRWPCIYLHRPDYIVYIALSLTCALGLVAGREDGKEWRIMENLFILLISSAVLADC